MGTACRKKNFGHFKFRLFDRCKYYCFITYYMFEVMGFLFKFLFYVLNDRTMELLLSSSMVELALYMTFFSNTAKGIIT